jgi:hypothetical protein
MGVSSSKLNIPGIGDPQHFPAKSGGLLASTVRISASVSRNLLEIRFECYQEASGFTACHDAMVKGE